MSNIDIEKTLSSEYTSITKDILEVGLDSILDDGILKDFPLIGGFVSLGKIGITINDRIFIKKLIHFLYETQNIPKHKREEVINKINESNKYQLSVGEKIIFILDKADSISKAKHVGKLFRYVLEEKIGYEMYSRCVNAINMIYDSDLTHFLKTQITDFSGSIEKDGLINSGILKVVSAEGETTMGGSVFELKYIISEVGECLRKYLGDKEEDWNYLQSLVQDNSKNKW